MKLLPSERFSLYGALTIFTVMIIFHLLVLSGIVPFGIVWGGRLKSHEEMVRFEIISLVSLLAMAVIVAIRAGLFRFSIPGLVFTVLFVLMGLLFLLNTLGNLASTNPLERALFTPVTLLLSLFAFRIAFARNKTKPASAV